MCEFGKDVSSSALIGAKRSAPIFSQLLVAADACWPEPEAS